MSVPTDLDVAAGRAVLDVIPTASEQELDAIRRDLDRRLAAVAHPARRRSALRSPRTAVALVAGVAVAIAAAVAFVPDGGRPGAVVPPASAADRIATAFDLQHQVAHYRVAASIGGLPVSYETWVTAAGSLTVGHEGGLVTERATTPTSASTWSAKRNLVVTADRASEASTDDGLSVGDVATRVKGGTVAVTETTADGRPAVRAAGRGGSIVFDAATLDPIAWQVDGANVDGNGAPLVYRFTSFDLLPLTPDTGRLIDLAARHPGARAVTDGALYDQVEDEILQGG